MLSKLELKVILRRCAFDGARSQCQFEVRGKSFFSSSSPVGDDRVVQVELKGERRSRERRVLVFAQKRDGAFEASRTHHVERGISENEPVEGHQGRQNEGVWRLRRLKELPVARARHFRRLRRRASRRRGEQEAEQQNEDASHHVRGPCLPTLWLSFLPAESFSQRVPSSTIEPHGRHGLTPRAPPPPPLAHRAPRAVPSQAARRARSVNHLHS